ncbi:PAS domain-containing sensor histidine kinase [Flavobacterium sp.]|uniref:PAS domain-containing sensor histidine kinase n=1 Tax=Flavobacterium sp. TaxID=239 RepID=UPI0025F28AC4|nr:PAS domain-containing sensor histidine kinase [Flavobacterium sp.]
MPTNISSDIPFLAGGGLMGQLIREKDWSKNLLGTPATWPQSLRTTLSLLLNSKFPMFLFWGPELICFYNDAYRPSLGNDNKHPDILGGRAEDYWKEIWKDIKPIIDKALKEGEASWFEDRLLPIYRNGKLEDIYWTFSYSPVNDESGKPAGVFVTCFESTEKVDTLKKLNNAEDRFRTMADNIPNLAWMANADGWIYWYNQKWYDYTGKTAEEMEGWGWQSVHDPEELPLVIEKWKESIDSGKDFEMVFPLKGADGKFKQFLTRVLPLKDAEGKIIQWYGSNTDISTHKEFTKELEIQVNKRTSELKQVNEILQKSEERYHLMVEEVQDYAILYLSKEGIVENWNKGVEKIQGYKAEEIVGKNFSAFYTEEDRKSDLPHYLLKKAVKNGRLHHEGWRVRKDGTLFWASVTITAIPNNSNEIIGFSKVIHDLTFKKEADDKIKLNTEILEQKNRELEKMNKELQSFAYISSHDLQEPLRKIQTFSNMIIEKEFDNLSEKGKDKFRRMQNAAQRMQTLINDLLAYSRSNAQETSLTKTNLNVLINDVKEDFREEIREKDAIISVDKIESEVAVVPFQIHQLLFNLISNSLKFSHDDIKPIITIKSEVKKGKDLHTEKLIDETEYCHITFSDNGIGFDQQYSDRIFEVFQRLHGKETYEGTGIGLAIVKKIIENHKGVITASSELNKGATFHIYLPVNV